MDWEPREPSELELEEAPRPRFPLVWRLVALIVALSFLAFALSLTIQWTLRIWPLPLLWWESRGLEAESPMPQVVPALVQVEGNQGRGGSGFNVCPQGTIVTTLHTLEGADSAEISFPAGQTYTSTAWEPVPALDLAIVDLEGPSGLPALEVGPELLQPGDPAWVAGYPFTVTRLVQEGKVENLRPPRRGSPPVLVLDLPVFPGQSGSPVLDGEGRVRGMVFAGTHTEETGRPRALAVPASAFAPLLNGETGTAKLPGRGQDRSQASIGARSCADNERAMRR